MSEKIIAIDLRGKSAQEVADEVGKNGAGPGKTHDATSMLFPKESSEGKSVMLVLIYKWKLDEVAFDFGNGGLQKLSFGQGLCEFSYPDGKKEWKFLRLP